MGIFLEENIEGQTREIGHGGGDHGGKIEWGIFGIDVVIHVVRLKAGGEGAHVALGARNLCADLSFEKIGDGDGREDRDDRDNDQQFDKRKGAKEVFGKVHRSVLFRF